MTETMWRREPKPRHGDGVTYSVLRLCDESFGMDALRKMFPNGTANDLNFVLFSTSGIHGSYGTIEDAEREMQSDDEPSVTFVVVQPRIVSMRYGCAHPKSADDIAFLKTLRSSSHRAVASIGIEKQGGGA